jgi:hypothetical protein
VYLIQRSATTPDPVAVRGNEGTPRPELESQRTALNQGRTSSEPALHRLDRG